MTNYNHPHDSNQDAAAFAATNLAEVLSFIDDSAAHGMFTAAEAETGKRKVQRWFDSIEDPLAQLDMIVKVCEEIQTIVTLKRLQAVKG